MKVKDLKLQHLVGTKIKGLATGQTGEIVALYVDRDCEIDIIWENNKVSRCYAHHCENEIVERKK